MFFPFNNSLLSGCFFIIRNDSSSPYSACFINYIFGWIQSYDWFDLFDSIIRVQNPFNYILLWHNLGCIPPGIFTLPQLVSFKYSSNPNLGTCAPTGQPSEVPTSFPTTFGSTLPPTKESERLALIDLYRATHQWLPWNISSDPCRASWRGLTCKADLDSLSHVTTLDLSGLKLNGTLPESIGLLRHLNYLLMSDNRLQG